MERRFWRRLGTRHGAGGMEPDQPGKSPSKISPNGGNPAGPTGDQPPAVGYRAGNEPAPADKSAASATPPPSDRSWPGEKSHLKGSHPGDRYVRVVHHAPVIRPDGRPARPGGPPPTPQRPVGPLTRWLLKGHLKEIDGPYEREHTDHTHPWWKVMTLTGVDYFSTLGYQPGIAARALAPIATLVLVLITLFGALPMYGRVARESPHGDGSISMLERLLPWWQGKIFVLALLGFVATGFVITITLSAADASAHVVENPYTHFLQGYEVPVTLALIALLGVVFLKGFSEAIGIAVGIVAVYLLLNLVVIVVGFTAIARDPQVLGNWRDALTQSYANPFVMVGAALLLFPKLALGLSGFETGVVVMPLVQGDPGDTEAEPTGRIRNARKLLASAALIMSVLL